MSSRIRSGFGSSALWTYVLHSGRALIAPDTKLEEVAFLVYGLPEFIRLGSSSATGLSQTEQFISGFWSCIVKDAFCCSPANASDVAPTCPAEYF